MDWQIKRIGVEIHNGRSQSPGMKSRAKANEQMIRMGGGVWPPKTNIVIILKLVLALDFISGFGIHPYGSFSIIEWPETGRNQTFLTGLGNCFPKVSRFRGFSGSSGLLLAPASLCPPWEPPGLETNKKLPWTSTSESV